MDQGTALIVGKVCALITILSFVLLPLAGCQGVDIYGYQILQDTSRDAQVFFILGWIVVIVCAIAFFASRPATLIGLGILGLVSMVAMLLHMKQTADPLFRAMVEFKPGAFVTILGFIGMIVVPLLGKSEKERKTSVEDDPPPNFQEEITIEFIGARLDGVQEFKDKAKKAISSIIPKMTNERLGVFFGVSIACFIMALNWLLSIGHLSDMSGSSGFWLGVRFPLWVYGVYWLITRYQKKAYPFDE